MTFANPIALLWGLLAVPIVWLYRQKVRVRREPVATEMIWQQVFAEEPGRTRWQRWRHPVSLGVQLTALALIVTALADPQIADDGGLVWPPRVVLVTTAVLLLATEWCLYQRRWIS